MKKIIADVVIATHLGEPHVTAKKLAGILVKDLMKNMELKEESSKLFGEFFLTFISVYNYKVVYCWNEIFNSPTGYNLYLVTSRLGHAIKDMEERIFKLIPTDFKTGRRYI